MSLPKNFKPDEYSTGEMSIRALMSRSTITQLTALIIVGLTVWIWTGILGASRAESALYFLDVGQGDSQLVVLASPDGKSEIKVLVDAGRGRGVLDSLDEALDKRNDKYIDILLLTHPHLDHFGGFVEVIKRYDVGLFVWNGHKSEEESFLALMNELAERAIPMLVLMEDDRIRYGNNSFLVISPDRAILESGDPDEASIVVMLASDRATALFTGDIGIPTERIIMDKGYDISADVLKVGHHGSKYSSEENFVSAVRPLVSVIEVGQNRYGHPAPRVMETLELAGSRVYRTDEHGTIKISLSAESGASGGLSDGRPGRLASIANVMTGRYKRQHITSVSLQEIREEKRPFELVSYTRCSFASARQATRFPVVINEVAWMGAESGASAEWIELKNISGESVNLSGWQLLNGNERLNATFPQKSVFEKPFILLARSVADTALGLGADIIFTGAIRNSGEGLRLFDNKCNLIDEVFASPNWPAGNNASKQTMERMPDLSWANSLRAGGTPGGENTGYPANSQKNAPSATNIKEKGISPAPPGCATGQININTATKEELMLIRHIGAARAEDLISKRPFSSVSDVGRVTGVGPSRVADIIAENKACAP